MMLYPLKKLLENYLKHSSSFSLGFWLLGMLMKYFTTILMCTFLLLSACTPLGEEPSYADQRLQQFSTSEELTAFLQEHQQQASNSGRAISAVFYTGAMEQPLDSGAPTALKATQTESSSSARYSQTNVQVEGVDEADIVKNDGKYIYTLTQNKVVLVDAYPPATATITATIDIPGQPRDLFINNNKLIVFTDLYPGYYTLGGVTRSLAEDTEAPVAKIAAPGFAPPHYDSPKTGVLIYDTTNKEDPQVIANYTVDGSYYQSRMIGNYVYIIAQHGAFYGGGPVPLPALRSEGDIIMESPVAYFDNWEPQIVFNSIASFNVQDVDDVNLQTFMLGYANTLYVSQDNIYIAYQKEVPYAYYRQDQENRFTKIIIPLLPDDIQKTMYRLLANKEDFAVIQQKMYETLEAYYNKLPPDERSELQQQIDKALQDYELKLQEERMKTIIHRLSLDNGLVTYENKGEVKGSLLNQFSLDEYETNLRVATTSYLYDGRGQLIFNNVYILDNDLDLLGDLEQIAPDERIYSTRFIGDRLYMVTFKQVDPLFVIDLSDTSEPKILGQLKIPGFSNYLHPYDENHILGLGQDTVEEQGRALTGGLKIALFDVSDVNNPKERAKLIIGKRGTYSEAFTDHKAFLFDSDRKLVIFPVSETKDASWEHVWQGVYVLRIKPDIGFNILGKITHGTYDPQKPYDTYSTQVRRALYIEDILYTVSPKKIKMNDLDDLQTEHKTIVLPYEQPDYGYAAY